MKPTVKYDKNKEYIILSIENIINIGIIIRSEFSHLYDMAWFTIF